MQTAAELVDDVGVKPIIEALGLSRSTYYRQRKAPSPPSARPTPARAMSPSERAQVLEVLHDPEFVDASPAEVHASLLTRGKYLCSLRSMYRVLAANKQVRERRNRLRHPKHQKPQLVATAPNQVWSWDITKLRTGVPFVYFYLFVILDIFSRYVVGWMIAERETSALAKILIAETFQREGIKRKQLILHADRGTQMVSHATAQLCATLGIQRSHNRPYVSNDNPYSESHFATAKQHPSFPGSFSSLVDTLTWGREFFPWYNHEHHHSGLAYLTPAEVHRGRIEDVLAKREGALQRAFELHPERFVRGMPKVQRPPRAVWINAPENKAAEEILRARGIMPAEGEVIAQ